MLHWVEKLTGESMTTKTWTIFAAICVAIIAGLIYVSGSNKIDVSDVKEQTILAGEERSGNIADQVFGKRDSKVMIIEYGDYQCPGCGTAAPVLKEVSEKYKDKIVFVFRNFPLYSAHPNALAAATVAEAAGKQGKFWEMHNALYERQSEWSQLSGVNRTDYFINLADTIGLDSNKLREGLSDKTIKQKIDFDVALGKKVGVTGTPSIFLNGKDFSTTRYKDGALTTGNTDDPLVWSSATAFENLVLKPALKEAGISTE